MRGWPNLQTNWLGQLATGSLASAQTHQNTLLAAWPMETDWIQARFCGKPAVSNCGFTPPVKPLHAERELGSAGTISEGHWPMTIRSCQDQWMAETLTATLHTNQGDIKLNLFPNHAPKTVRNFVGLADGTQEWKDPKTNSAGSGPLYDGVIFHRVIQGFMIQGGDPLGTGTGGRATSSLMSSTPSSSSIARICSRWQMPDRGRMVRSSSSQRCQRRGSRISTRSSAR